MRGVTNPCRRLDDLVDSRVGGAALRRKRQHRHSRLLPRQLGKSRRRRDRHGGELISGGVGQHAAVAIDERAAIGQNEKERTTHDRDVGRNVEHPDARTDDITGRTSGPGDSAVGPAALHQCGGDGERVIDVERPTCPWAISDSSELRDQLVGLGVRSIGQ